MPRGRTWRHRPLEALRESLSRDPVTASLIEDREPVGKVRGTIKERYYFRRGAGPGLERWWRARDVEALPHYYWGRDEVAPVLRALAGSLLRGRVQALRELLEQVRRAKEFRRELARRRKLLERATA